MATTSVTKAAGWRRIPVWLVAATVWTIMGGSLFGLFWSFDSHQRQLYEVLRSHSIATAGVIVAKDTQDHDSMTYRYVDAVGHRYDGGDQGEGQEQGDPADLEVGTEITVYYDPARPTVSCYCTPALNPIGGLYVQEVLISQFLTVPFSTLTTIAFWRWRTGRPSLAQLRRDRRRRYCAP